MTAQLTNSTKRIQQHPQPATRVLTGVTGRRLIVDVQGEYDEDDIIVTSERRRDRIESYPFVRRVIDETMASFCKKIGQKFGHYTLKEVSVVALQRFERALRSTNGKMRREQRTIFHRWCTHMGFFLLLNGTEQRSTGDVSAMLLLLCGDIERNPGPPKKADRKGKSPVHSAESAEKVKRPKLKRPPRKEVKRSVAVARSIAGTSAQALGQADAAIERMQDPDSKHTVGAGSPDFPPEPRIESDFVHSGYVDYHVTNPILSDAQLSEAALPFPIEGSKIVYFEWFSQRSVPLEMKGQEGKETVVSRDGRPPSQLTVPLDQPKISPYTRMVIRYYVKTRHPLDIQREEFAAEPSGTVELPYEAMISWGLSLIGSTQTTFEQAFHRTETVMARYYPDPADYTKNYGDFRMRVIIAAAILYLSTNGTHESGSWGSFLWRNVLSGAWTQMERQIYAADDVNHRRAPGYYITGTTDDFSLLLDIPLRAGSAFKMRLGAYRQKKLAAPGPDELDDLSRKRCRMNSILPVVEDSLDGVPSTSASAVKAAFNKRLGREVAAVDMRVKGLIEAVCRMITQPRETAVTPSPDQVVLDVKKAGAFREWSAGDREQADLAGQHYIAGDFRKFYQMMESNGCFIKNEVLKGGKPVRFIVSPKPYVRAMTAYLLHDTTHTLVHSTMLGDMLTKGLTDEERDGRVVERIGAFLTMGRTVTTDITSMESQVRGVYLGLERVAFLQASSLAARESIDHYFSVRHAHACKAKNRSFEVIFGPCRLSGTQETSMGNCVVNACWQITSEIITSRLASGMTVDDALHSHEDTLLSEIQTSYAHRQGLVEGDDGIIPNHFTSPASRATYVYVMRDIFGVDFKLEDEGAFCGTTFYQSAQGVLHVVDPRILLLKLSAVWSESETTRHDARLAVAKALSYLRKYRQIPIIRKVCATILLRYHSVIDEVRSLIRLGKYGQLGMTKYEAEQHGADFGADSVTYDELMASLGFEECDPFVEEILRDKFGTTPSYYTTLFSEWRTAFDTMCSGAKQVLIPRLLAMRAHAQCIFEYVRDARSHAEAAYRYVMARAAADNLRDKSGIAYENLKKFGQRLLNIYVGLSTLLMVTFFVSPLVGFIVFTSISVVLSAIIALSCKLFLGWPFSKCLSSFLLNALVAPFAALVPLFLYSFRFAQYWPSDWRDNVFSLAQQNIHLMESVSSLLYWLPLRMKARLWIMFRSLRSTVTEIGSWSVRNLQEWYYERYGHRISSMATSVKEWALWLIHWRVGRKTPVPRSPDDVELDEMEEDDLSEADVVLDEFGVPISESFGGDSAGTSADARGPGIPGGGVD